MREWSDVLPHGIAKRQKAWERRHAVLRAVNTGEQQKNIAAFLGVHSSMVGQMVHKAKRDVAERRTPPIERYFAESPLQVRSG